VVSHQIEKDSQPLEHNGPSDSDSGDQMDTNSIHDVLDGLGLTQHSPQILLNMSKSTPASSVLYTFYPIEANNVSACSSSDLAFLQAEGCFHLPVKEILDLIVDQYFLHVHPLLPILHEGDFWRVYSQQNHKHEYASLLVVQALVFACCNVSSIQHLFITKLIRFSVSTH
jgi:hypothetical protein